MSDEEARLEEVRVNLTPTEELRALNGAEPSQSLIRQSVIWLSLTVQKGILRLTEEDYITQGLEVLLRGPENPVHQLNLDVFYSMQGAITGWPGGKAKGQQAQTSPSTSPGAPPTAAVLTAGPFPKRVVVFSPHPDDDVISMGGTFYRLVQQGHDVHVCYQTSGNNAVWNDDVRRYTWFVEQFAREFLDAETAEKVAGVRRIVEEEGGIDASISAPPSPHAGQNPTTFTTSRELLTSKALIRCSEARAAAKFCGVKDENIHFLKMPFYETGANKKNPIGQADYDVVKAILEEVKPDQIYCAGDLKDPNGTHRTCLKAVVMALKQFLDSHVEWLNECTVWLYRGAWQEWEPHLIEMAVPMSPQELYIKRLAIFKHQSQKDPPVFPGDDKREFWQRTEARNRGTAKLYDRLGLPEFEALEAFARLDLKDHHQVEVMLQGGEDNASEPPPSSSGPVIPPVPLYP